MRAGLLLISSALIAVAASACARGSSIDPSSGGTAGAGGAPTVSTSGSTSVSSGGTGGASSSSSSGAGGSASSSSSSSSSSGSSTSSSSSSSGCPATPCKVTTPQCGCTAPEVCTIEGNAVACGAAGTKGDGQSCGTSASDQCAGGFVCVQASPTASQCLEFCDADSECNAPGGLCLLELNDGLGGSIPNVTLCTPNCSPVTNAGCPSGSGCALLRENGGLMRWLTLCGPVGVKTQGQSCNPNAASPECAATYACIDDGTGSKCLRYCDVNAPNCGGLFCAQLQDNSVPPQPITLGAVTFGACL